MFAQIEPQTEPQVGQVEQTTKIELQFDPKAISFRLATQELVKRGIPLVPIPPKTKACQLPNWPALATTDLAVIKEWRKGGLNQNVGAVAKGYGCCILDIDDADILKTLPNGYTIPATFVVKSSKGFHHYFKQTDRTRALGNINVSDPDNPKHRLFDFQQHNKYVVAPYSIHPDGPIYTIQDSSEIIECPDWLVQWMTEQDARQPSPSQKPSQAGSQVGQPKKGLVIKPRTTTKKEFEYFLDLHGESLLEGEYNEAKKRWEWLRADRCPWEDEHTGKNQPTDFAVYLYDDGVRGIHCVHRCATTKHWNDYREFLEKRTGWTFDAEGKKVFVPDDESGAEEWVNFPHNALLGGWLGEITDICTDGTTLSKEMADMYQRVILGILIDGHVGWPQTAPMHMKTWAINVAPPGTGKGELWKRLGSEFMWSDSPDGGIRGVYGNLLKVHNVEIISGLGSSEGLIKTVRDASAYRALTRFDELSGLFEKNARLGSSMLSSLRSLFDQAKMENRTASRGVEPLLVRLGLAADIQPHIFDKLVSANDLKNDGFLRRIVFAHAERLPHGSLPQLTEEQIEKLKGLTQKISARVEELKAFGYDHPAEIQFKPMHYQKAFCPVIAGEAKAIYDSFEKELEQNIERASDRSGCGRTIGSRTSEVRSELQRGMLDVGRNSTGRRSH